MAGGIRTIRDVALFFQRKCKLCKLDFVKVEIMRDINKSIKNHSDRDSQKEYDADDIISDIFFEDHTI